PKIATKILSVDAAFKDEDDSDFVSVQVWGKNGPNMYMIENVTARMNFIATIQTIRNLLKKHPDITGKYIEDKANGTAIISMLRREVGGVVAVNPQGGKIARVNAISPYIESGN